VAFGAPCVAARVAEVGTGTGECDGKKGGFGVAAAQIGVRSHRAVDRRAEGTDDRAMGREHRTGRARRVAAVACLWLLSLSAACGPSIANLPSAKSCHVWLDGTTANIVAEVGKRAVVQGTMGDIGGAYFTGDRTVVFPGMMGDVQATYEPPRVIVHGYTGDLEATIGADHAIVDGFLGDLRIDFNRACSDRQQALGVISVMVVAASS